MESLLFMFDSLAMVLLVFMGLRDDRRAPGAPHTSIFRMRDVAQPARPARRAHSDRTGPGTDDLP